MKRGDIIAGLLTAIGISLFSFLVSTSPDGLERVAGDKNFINKTKIFFRSPVPDYIFPWVKNKKAAAAIAGACGALLVFAMGMALPRAIRKK